MQQEGGKREGAGAVCMRHAVFMLDCAAQVLARTLRWLFLFDFLFVVFFFFVTFLPLPFCTFGQRSRRTPAWTRIGNNLLCLTAGMYVCVTARPHAHECIILTFAWRVSWPRCLFRPFGISPTLFLPYPFGLNILINWLSL